MAGVLLGKNVSNTFLKISVQDFSIEDYSLSQTELICKEVSLHYACVVNAAFFPPGKGGKGEGKHRVGTANVSGMVVSSLAKVTWP